MIYISRIIKHFVGAFDKMEKYMKFSHFLYITSVKTLHFKGFMADSMLRTHPFPHFVKKKTVEGNLEWKVGIGKRVKWITLCDLLSTPCGRLIESTTTLYRDRKSIRQWKFHIFDMRVDILVPVHSGGWLFFSSAVRNPLFYINRKYYRTFSVHEIAPTLRRMIV